MAIAHVVSTSAIGADGSTVTTSGINTTGATLIVVGVLTGNGAGVATPTDSKSNSWSALSTFNNGSTAGKVKLFYSTPSSVGAGHTFTFASGGAGAVIGVSAFSGTSGTSLADVESGDTANPLGSTIQTGSITPTTAGDVLVTIYGWNANSDTASINLSFTIGSQTDHNAFNPGVAIAYLIQGAAAAKNPTWTVSNFQNVSTSIAAFKETDGGGGGGGGVAKGLLLLGC